MLVGDDFFMVFVLEKVCVRVRDVCGCGNVWRAVRRFKFETRERRECDL